MKYRERVTALKTILRKAFRMRYSILITERRIELNSYQARSISTNRKKAFPRNS
jgi:hypothetical protein